MPFPFAAGSATYVDAVVGGEEGGNAGMRRSRSLTAVRIEERSFDSLRSLRMTILVG